MMNQQPMMANLNSPVSTGAMMNNMMTGGRPPANGGQQRSVWRGPYGVIYDATEKAKRHAGYYDTDMGLIHQMVAGDDEFFEQEDAYMNSPAYEDYKHEMGRYGVWRWDKPERGGPQVPLWWYGK